MNKYNLKCMSYANLFDAIHQDAAVLEIEQLIRSTSDLDRVDRKGNTALLYAVMGDRVDIVKLLLKAGASVRITDILHQKAGAIIHMQHNRQLCNQSWSPPLLPYSHSEFLLLCALQFLS